MTGFVNKAGARSGAIGRTELDYEEGVWIPTWTLGSGTATITASYNALGYTKIGSIVYCSGRIENSR